jgi:hypothetical protein
MTISGDRQTDLVLGAWIGGILVLATATLLMAHRRMAPELAAAQARRADVALLKSESRR